MAWQQAATVFGAGAAFDPGLEEVSNNAQQRQTAHKNQSSSSIVAARGRLQHNAGQQSIDQGGRKSANETFPGFARTDLRRQLAAAKAPPRKISGSIGGPHDGQHAK